MDIDNAEIIVKASNFKFLQLSCGSSLISLDTRYTGYDPVEPHLSFSEERLRSPVDYLPIVFEI